MFDYQAIKAVRACARTRLGGPEPDAKSANKNIGKVSQSDLTSCISVQLVILLLNTIRYLSQELLSLLDLL